MINPESTYFTSWGRERAIPSCPPAPKKGQGPLAYIKGEWVSFSETDLPSWREERAIPSCPPAPKKGQGPLAYIKGEWVSYSQKDSPRKQDVDTEMAAIFSRFAK